MRRVILVLTALIMFSFISWLIDVFGRTLTPVHPRIKDTSSWMNDPNRTWDGHIRVQKRSDQVAALHW